MTDTIQIETANDAARGAVEQYREAKAQIYQAERNAAQDGETWPNDPPPGTVGSDDQFTPIEVALRATVIQAMQDAFNGIANPVNPGESQTRAAEGAIAGAGLPRDPITGHLTGIEPAPLPITTATDYPKWIEPHKSHVVKSEEGRVVTVTGSSGDVHVERGTGKVTVLVQTEEDEKRLTSAKQEDAPDADGVDGATGTDDPVNDTTGGMGVGSDPTGAKTVYPATSTDAEKADPEGLAESAATLNEERPAGTSGQHAPKKPESKGQRAR